MVFISFVIASLVPLPLNMSAFPLTEPHKVFAEPPVVAIHMLASMTGSKSSIKDGGLIISQLRFEEPELVMVKVKVVESSQGSVALKEDGEIEITGCAKLVSKQTNMQHKKSRNSFFINKRF